MIPTRNFVALRALLTALFLGTATLAPAQSIFDPVLRVNDILISQYDIDQRAALLRFLGAPGTLESVAREALIEEALQLSAAQQAGIEATEEGITQAIDSFAGRGNVTADEFLFLLGERGIDEETFENFVISQLVWREVIRSRFAPRVRVTEDDVDRAVALASREGGARVLLSEIILPARNPEEQARADEIAAQIAEIDTLEGFAAAARNVSVAPSRDRGGRLDWLSLSDLPPQLQSQLLVLPPGGVTEPARLQGAVAIFQLRALQETPVREAETISMEYAEFFLPGGSEADARRIAGEIDTCDDLFGVAKGLPEDRLFREARPVAEIPADVRAILNNMDPNDVSTAIRRGNVQVLLMLCNRTTAVTEEADRGAFRRELAAQRIDSYASAFLAELRDEALIVDLR